MLVFKRALSIALAVSFAMPTVTLAKVEKRAPARQQNVKTTMANPAARRMPASKKVAVKSVGRMPARMAKKDKAPSGLSIVGGQIYQISEDVGRKGRLKSRTLTGPNYSELLLDKNEDGFVDVIEVRRGDVTTTASWPFLGKFRRVDVEQKTKNGIIKTQLLLAADNSAYEIVDQRLYPYAKFGATTASAGSNTASNPAPAPTATPGRRGLFARRNPRPTPTPAPSAHTSSDATLHALNAGVLGQTFMNSDRRARECETPIMINSLDALDRALRAADARLTTWSMEDILQCQIKKFQPLIMDQTCLDPRGRWNTGGDRDDQGLAHIRFGLARVMASHYESPPEGKDRGSYLRCLDHHGWSDSATRVNQFVWQRFRNISASLMEAGLTAEDFAEIFSQVGDGSTCTLPDVIVGPRSGRQVRMSEIAATLARSNTPPTIACSANPNVGRRAEFDNGTIRLFSAPSAIAADTPFCRDRSCNPSDAYAATFFHEMVHASGFGHEHEAIVENAENCCSVSSGSSSRDLDACAATNASSRFIGALQQNQTLLTTLMPGYNEVVARVQEDFQPNGQQMLNQYTGNVTNIINNNLDDVARELEKCRARGTPAARGECETNAFLTVNTQIRNETERFFQNECVAFAAIGTRRPGAGACQEIKTRFMGMLARGEENNRSSTVDRLVVLNMEPSLVTSLDLSSQLTIPQYRMNEDGDLVQEGTTTLRYDSQGRLVTATPTNPAPAVNASATDRVQNTGATGLVSDTSVDEDNTYPADPSVIEAIRVRPVTAVELPPLAQQPTEQPVVSSPVQLSNRFSTTTTTVAPQQAGAATDSRNRPVSQPTNSSTSPTTLSNRFSTTTSTTTTSPRPTSTESSSSTNFQSGLSMPSPTNSSGATLGVSSPTRGDGVTNRQLPLETYANQATRTVANIGQAVVGNTPQAQAATPPPPNRRPVNPAPVPAAAQPSAVVANGPAAAPSLGLQTSSTIVLAGSAVTSPERSIAMVRNRGENAINPIIPVSSGSDRTRRPASERDRERERRGDPQARSAGGPGAAGASGRSNDGSSQDEGEDSNDGRPRARRDGDTIAGRSLAADPSAPEAGRAVNRPSFNTVQDASGMTVYIGRMNTTEVPNLLVNRTFVRKMRTIGIAVRDPNGNRIGAPPPAPLMELCQTRQRYVLEGTCR